MKKLFKTIGENYKLVLGVLIAGLFLGWLLFHPSKSERSLEDQTESHEGHDHSAEDPGVWTCSMHPQIRQEQPGQCPICAMDLIPLNTTELAGEDMDPRAIAMSESAARLADIQTVAVSRGAPEKTLLLQGKVEADERNIAELTARFGGRIEKLFVNFTGQHVQQGEKMATLYSPDLIAAQRELLEAVSLKESRPSLYRAARTKLKLWDLGDEQIAAIEDQGDPLLYFDVLAPISGTVMDRHVALGNYVEEGSALFRLSDLRKVWVLFDAYESDLPWIRTGDPVNFTIPSVPGKEFTGKVAYIDPVIHPQTRVARVRIELSNPGYELKPGMFANGVLRSRMAASADELLIPKSAVLWTGKRAVVYVRLPDRESPSFRYREITLGPEAGNFYVVAGGLSEGEVIAVNGVFKIDAAAQLEGKPSMMNPGGGNAPSGHDHGSMGQMGETGQSESQSMEPALPVEEVSPAFREQLQQVYDAYIRMTDAFVATDARQVGIEAREVKSGLQQVDMELLQGDAHTEWMAELGELNKSIDRIANSTEISDQRLAFAEFNNTFYKILKTFGLQQGTTYYQYCPMANGDVGAYWFSNKKEIENPYFGDEMLRCGETRDTLEF